MNRRSRLRFSRRERAIGIAIAVLLVIGGGIIVYALRDHFPTPVGRASASATTSPVPTAFASASTTTSAAPSATPTGSPAGSKTFVTSDGQWTEFIVPTANPIPDQLAKGPDGAIWFTENGSSKIGRIDASGSIREFSLPNQQSSPGSITSGPDGALWFAELGKIGRITTDGHITEFSLSWSPTNPEGITTGPDGALWFADQTANVIGRITTTGKISNFSLPQRGGAQCGYVCPQGIVSGPDGALWFTETQFAPWGSRIGRLTVAGQLTEYTVASGIPSWITVGHDGNLWFSESNAGEIGRITPSGSITEFTLHTANLGAAAWNVAPGPLNSVWFPVNKAHPGSAATGNQLGRIQTDGAITGYVIPGSSTVAGGITEGADGSIWFSYGADQVWRFQPKN